jgi:hypothetical protein
MKLGMKEIAMKYLIVTSLTLVLLILTGCNKSKLSQGEFPLSIVEPANGNECLDDIPAVRYKVKATNGAGEEETLEFNWPWYTAKIFSMERSQSKESPGGFSRPI